MGFGDSLADQVLAEHVEGLEFDPQHPHKKLGGGHPLAIPELG